ncbi:hypothetical protein BGZ52_000099 [Haplosporangium bisporale]|nr:hypothetical protein BGZ52_000099 [Haplosporangium bisporale]
MSLVIVSSLLIIWKVAPKYGKKHMLVYITVCSLIGSLSVVATQGLGAAIVLNITKGIPQFNHWFIYVTMVFVVCTLIAEINYLNKALNLFNTAMVTPVYYVFFTSATLIASVILFQGFSASPSAIMTVVMGFFVICAGVVLLQTSKSAAHSEAMKRSKSNLSLQSENGDEINDYLDDQKEGLELGPLGLRAVPFDAIRQMVRASTMPNTPHTTPGATPVTVHMANNAVHHTGRSLFGRSRKSETGATPGGSITPSSAVDGVLITDEHARHPMQAVVIPISDKADYNEEHGAITLPQIAHQDKDEADTPLTSQTLTLHGKE